LITGGLLPSGFYWHIVHDEWGPTLEPAPGLFNPGDDIHVRVTVSGDTYSAFLNGSTTPATTLTTGDFPHGQVALYDFSAQAFDNVRVVPEPSALVGLVTLCLGALLLGWRRKRVP